MTIWPGLYPTRTEKRMDWLRFLFKWKDMTDDGVLLAENMVSVQKSQPVGTGAMPQVAAGYRVPLIFRALANVQREIHSVGIGKLRRNQEQKFNFRGIDDALMAFAPLLTENGVLLAPSYANRVIEARQTKSGGTTYNVTLEGTFTFICVEDGSTHTVGPFFGEANDGQDKAVSKATSVAERNMFFLTFVVPHEPAIGGDPDGVSEEETSDFDVAPWYQVIAEAEDMDALNKAANELRDAKIPDAALRNIRAKWAARAKELRA